PDRGGSARERWSSADERASATAKRAASSPQKSARRAASSDPSRCVSARIRGASSAGDPSRTAAAPYASACAGGTGPPRGGGGRGGTSVPAAKYASRGRAVLRVPKIQAPAVRTSAPAGVWYKP